MSAPRLAPALSIAAALALAGAPAAATTFAQPKRERLQSPEDPAWVVVAQGNDVAIHGDGALVGASLTTVDAAPNTGLVTLYGRDVDGWSPRSHLPGPVGAGFFGYAVAQSPAWRAVSAPGIGQVHLFEETGDETWPAPMIVTPPGPATNFGACLALAGTSLLVGAEGSVADIGRVFTYRHEEASELWDPEAAFTAPTPVLGDAFGRALAVAGNTAFIGAPGTDPGGAVYPLTRAGPEIPWVLTPTPILPGQADLRDFGAAIAVSDALLAIGAPASFTGRGRVIVYQRVADKWVAISTLEPPAEAVAQHPTLRFGAALALVEGALLVGAPGAGSGAVYLFNEPLLGGAPSVIVTDPAADDLSNFGARLKIDGRRVAVGAPGTGIAADPGLAYVLELRTAVGELCDDASECGSGYCVDGLCCDKACDDVCVACSVAGGGGLDGACTPQLCPDTQVCKADVCVDPGGSDGTGSGGSETSGGATGASTGESDAATGGLPGLVLDPIADSGCACAAAGGRAQGPASALGLLGLSGLARRRRRRR